MGVGEGEECVRFLGAVISQVTSTQYCAYVTSVLSILATVIAAGKIQQICL